MTDERMISRKRQRFARTFVAAALVVGLIGASACGEGTYHFGGDFSDDKDSVRSVKLTGNVEDIRPPNAVRELVAFAYTNLTEADLADGPPFNDFKDGGSAVVDENGDFTLTRLSAGNVTVIFLLDDPEPDGSIDPGDDCSVLVKSGGLKNIKGGQEGTLENVEVGFRTEDCQNFDVQAPAATCFCSEADRIQIAVDRSSREN